MRTRRFVPILLSILFGSLLSLKAELVKGSKQLGAIWFVGSSTIQGLADGDPEGSPRQALYQLLKEGGYEFTFTGHSIANPDGLPVTGDTPETNLYHYHSGVSGAVIGANLSSPKPRVGITQNLPAFWRQGRLAIVKPNLIILLIGANDMDINLAASTAPERLSALIDTILIQPGIGNPTILVSGITPNRVVASNAEERGKAFNRAIPEVVAKFRQQGKEVYAIDLFTVVDREYQRAMNLNPAGDPPRYDYLHPGRYGNQLIARQWFLKIQQLSS